MALSDSELQDIISSLSPEDRQKLLSQLNRQVQVDNISNPTHATGQKTQPKVKPKNADSKVYCCPICGSASYKKKGYTNQSIELLRQAIPLTPIELTQEEWDREIYHFVELVTDGNEKDPHNQLEIIEILQKYGILHEPHNIHFSPSV